MHSLVTDTYIQYVTDYNKKNFKGRSQWVKLENKSHVIEMHFIPYVFLHTVYIKAS